MSVNFSTGHANMVCAAFKAAYTHGILGIYGGADMPASPDLAEAGVLLALITLNGAGFTPGILANGLTFNDPVNGVITKSTDIWSGVGLPAADAGTLATYWRLYTNTFTQGASTTATRIDGDIAQIGSTDPLDAAKALQLDSITIVAGIYTYVNTFSYTPQLV